MEETRNDEKKKGRFDHRLTKDEYQFLFAVAFVVMITAAVIILFYFAIARYEGFKEGWDSFSTIVQPFIIGLAMAFLMNPFMKIFEKLGLKWFLPRTKAGKEKKTKKTVRVISSILALLVLLGAIAIIFSLIIPQVISTFQYILNHLDQQILGVLEWANDITGGAYQKDIRNAEKNMDMDAWLETAWGWICSYLQIGTDNDAMISVVTDSVISVGHLLVNIIIGIIVSVYILIDKEKAKGQAKKIIYGIFKPSWANEILDVVRKADEVFYGFIIGKIIDSIIIGIICYICMLIMGLPYQILVSVIIGVTNIIPVFGPYIGAVPTVTIIFLMNPMQGIYFLILILVLQQFDGNILGPKILGDSTGLSSFWVVVAIVVGGGLFGVGGMLLGVPIMSLIYYICGKIATYKVAKRNLPTQTKVYRDLKAIDTKTNEVIIMTQEERESRDHFLTNMKNVKKSKEEKPDSTEKEDSKSEGEK